MWLSAGTDAIDVTSSGDDHRRFVPGDRHAAVFIRIPVPLWLFDAFLSIRLWAPWRGVV